MKKIAFIADLYFSEILGGGENNDANLINHLKEKYEVICHKTNEVSVADLEDVDGAIVGNFVLLPEHMKNYLIDNKKYIIYEHDHKYVTTRDPSKFINFNIPDKNIINQNFYCGAQAVYVLSNICRKVLNHNIPDAKVKNIGCSLWSEEKFDLLLSLSKNTKSKDLCVMYSSNPTKNYPFTVEYCNKNKISYDVIQTKTPDEFLTEMSQYDKFLFIPTVLETFSRICAEAKMLNVKVMTNKAMIGFFSEEISSLSGEELIQALRQRNAAAYEMFCNEIEEM
jgi:hypothetical protein